VPLIDRVNGLRLRTAKDSAACFQQPSRDTDAMQPALPHRGRFRNQTFSGAHRAMEIRA
jgi:hypothetical protein